MYPRINALSSAAQHSQLLLLQVLAPQAAEKTINEQDEHGNTPLHMAVIRLCEVATVLSEQNYDIFKKSSDNDDDYNCDRQFDVVLCLAEVAETSIRNHEKKQPIHIFLDSRVNFLNHLDYKRVCKVVEKLITTDTVNHIITRDTVKDIIMPGMVNSVYVVEEESLLTRSIRFQQFELAEHLLEKGADVTIVSRCGHSALHEYAGSAEDEGSLELARKLSQHGMLNAQDFEGNTPLHKAVKYGQSEVYKQLCSLNADMSVINRYGDLAISMCTNDIPSDLFHELLKVQLKGRRCIGALQYLNFLDEILTGLTDIYDLKEIVQTLCEKLHAKYHLYGFRCFASINFRRPSTIFIYMNNDTLIGEFFPSIVEGFFHLLFCLPNIRIHGFPPEALYAPGRWPNKEEEDHAKNIDQLWSNYATKRRIVPPLFQLCLERVRVALHPITEEKVDILQLPHLKEDILQAADIAGLTYKLMVYAKKNIIQMTWTGGLDDSIS